eukprot:TRINITY_DN13577_c2_g1_i1.p1 TRINITY_DN13577_c2_g1~~TRINITY_DN13577_c2_g1_i1.p1  ORF type:complete len:344 (-),score=61.64 TRINITY_DN13577_c2_g1_i1:125-1156(-)
MPPWFESEMDPVAIVWGDIRVSVRDTSALADVLTTLSLHHPTEADGMVCIDTAAAVLKLASRVKEAMGSHHDVKYVSLDDALRTNRQRLSARLWKELSNVNSAACILRDISERTSNTLVERLKDELHAGQHDKMETCSCASSAASGDPANSRSPCVADITELDEFFTVPTSHASTQTDETPSGSCSSTLETLQTSSDVEAIASSLVDEGTGALDKIRILSFGDKLCTPSSSFVANILASRLQTCHDIAQSCHESLSASLRCVTAASDDPGTWERRRQQTEQLTRFAIMTVCELETLQQVAANADDILGIADSLPADEKDPSQGSTASTMASGKYTSSCFSGSR